MEISVLTDNNTGRGFVAEHGLSYYITHENTKILFDAGQSDVFVKNASLMNVDLSAINFIVLSHGHFDHGNGLNYLNGGNLICHPDCFIKRYRYIDKTYIGLNLTGKEIKNKFNLIKSAGPKWLTQSIVFLGEVPRKTSFESKKTSFILENGEKDFVTDDSALVIILKNGLFIITGCGHAGIVNTIEHAIVVTGIPQIAGVMGGFHLKEINRQTRETINYLKFHNAKHILPAHCTSLPVVNEFISIFNGQQVKTGERFCFE
ncbi:MAG: MBL fold metallo-hydrolase [Bacteroidales bacterium]|nr:MBL fold metallo-hydrolase [Bacteroidales bacterium]